MHEVHILTYGHHLRSEERSGERSETRRLSYRDGVLNDPMALTIEDTSAVGEQRFVTIGANAFGHLRIVVYTHRGDDERIISVRKPEPKEVRAYEKGI